MAEDLAFKPYACGTMTQPFIDCARALAAAGVSAESIVEIECDVGEGTVHRLWEPLASKQRPPTPYAAKFSTPYCMAVGFLDGRAGFAQFTEARIAIRGRRWPRGFAKLTPDEYPRTLGHCGPPRDGSLLDYRHRTCGAAHGNR